MIYAVDVLLPRQKVCRQFRDLQHETRLGKTQVAGCDGQDRGGC